MILYCAFTATISTRLRIWPTAARGGPYLRRARRDGGSRERAGRPLRGHLRTPRALRAHGRSAELPTVRAGVAGAHAHVVRRRGSRTVRGADARVVLRPAPAEADARVADGVALHLVDGHLRCVPVHELDEAAALARRNLDVGDLTESLEERAELILGHIAREASHEDGRVVGVRELVHLRRGVEASAGTATVRGREGTRPHVLLGNVVHHRGGSVVAGESVGAG